MSSLIRAKVLPEGMTVQPGDGIAQFNRLSLVEIMEFVLGYLKTKKLSAEERDIEKRVGDALLLLKGTPGDFVHIDESEWELLGIRYYMKHLGGIRKMAGKMRMIGRTE